MFSYFYAKQTKLNLTIDISRICWNIFRTINNFLSVKSWCSRKVAQRSEKMLIFYCSKLWHLPPLIEIELLLPKKMEITLKLKIASYDMKYFKCKNCKQKFLDFMKTLWDSISIKEKIAKNSHKRYEKNRANNYLPNNVPKLEL